MIRKRNNISYTVLPVFIIMILIFLFLYSIFCSYNNAYTINNLGVQANNKGLKIYFYFVEDIFPIVKTAYCSESNNILSAKKNNNTNSFIKNVFKNTIPVMGSSDFEEIKNNSEIKNNKNNHNTNINTETEIKSAANITRSESERRDKKDIVESKNIVSPEKTSIDVNNPSILVYHTHSTESYMPEKKGNFHALEKKCTVRKVGDILCDTLQKKGYKVIHDETIHDYPSYSKSYIKSLETLEKNINQHKSLKVIIDLHRDAADYTNDINYTIINNEKVARFSIVVGTKNENYKKLKVFANYIIEKSNELYPGLANKIIEKPYKFNEYKSDYYILLELGNNQNDIKEAERTAVLFGEILAETIKDIKQ